MTTGRIPSVDGGIQPTIIDAAGDLIYGASNDTPARLAIGTAGQVLTVNSGATAPEWAAAGGNSINLIPTNESVYTRVLTNSNVANSINTTLSTTYYTPVYLPTCTLDRIGVLTSTTTPTSGNLTRLGIYNNSTNNKPSTVVLDAGTVDPDAPSTAYEITISQSINEGWYWLAMNRQGDAGTSPTYRAVDSGNTVAALPILSSIATGNFTGKGYLENNITGAFTTASTLTLTYSSMPAIWVRIS